MLFLLALPVFCAAALGHCYLQIYAPSNVLIRKIRGSAPNWRTAAGLVALGALLLLLTHALAEVIAVGAPAWLNLLVLLLAWDAIKIECLATSVGLRALAAAGREVIQTRCTIGAAGLPQSIWFVDRSPRGQFGGRLL